MAYIRIPLETNPETLAQQVFAEIQARAPEWLPADGNLDVWIIRAIARKAAENRDLASDVQDDIFRYFGATLMQIPPLPATPAQSSTNWTMIDTAGYTIPDGTYVGIRNSAQELIPFITLGDAIAPPGSATISGLSIMAVEPGSTGSGLTGAVELLDVLDYVQSVTLVSPTTGGTDAELDEDYLDRLTNRLTRLSTRPILPEDFAEATLDASPVVWRALALDGYDPATGTYNNERMVTVAAVDENGEAVSTAVKNEIDAYLEANREQNFIVHVIDPTYTIIDVDTTVVLAPTYASAEVIANVTEEIQRYLSPKAWATDQTPGEPEGRLTWVESPVVYYNEMIALVSNVEGVYRVVDLTMRTGAGAMARVDITIATPAGLTRAGAISVTVA